MFKDKNLTVTDNGESRKRLTLSAPFILLSANDHRPYNYEAV